MHNVLGAEEVEQLSEVMNEAGDLHPLRLAVPTNGLCGLQEVLDLGELSLNSELILGRAMLRKRLRRGLSRPRECSVSQWPPTRLSQSVSKIHGMPAQRHTHSSAHRLLELGTDTNVVLDRLFLCTSSIDSHQGWTAGKSVTGMNIPCCSR